MFWPCTRTALLQVLSHSQHCSVFPFASFAGCASCIFSQLTQAIGERIELYWYPKFIFISRPLQFKRNKFTIGSKIRNVQNFQYQSNYSKIPFHANVAQDAEWDTQMIFNWQIFSRILSLSFLCASARYRHSGPHHLFCMKYSPEEIAVFRVKTSQKRSNEDSKNVDKLVGGRRLCCVVRHRVCTFAV